MRAHQIQNGVIINTIEVDSIDVMPGLIEATEGGVGWLWDGEQFTSPPATPVPVPQSVTMRQARLALHGAGLLTTVAAAITQAGPVAQIEWEYAQSVDRAAGLVPAMAAALGMTEPQIDDLFIAASAL